MTISVFLASEYDTMRILLRIVLELNADLTVVGDAADEQSAARQIIQCCPDVVVLDLSIFERINLEAAQRLHQLYPSAQLILLSFYPFDEAIVQQALADGIRGHVVKDAVVDELVEAIHAVYAGKHYLSRKLVNYWLINAWGEPAMRGESIITNQQAFAGARALDPAV